MHEKRRHKRYLVYDMDINGKMTFAAEVKILNISISGVSLEVDKRMEIGSEYTLRLEDRDKEIALKGVVVWSSISGIHEGHHGEAIPIYTAGMKFTNILSERMMEFISFIEDHKTSVDHRLNGLRFIISDPEKAVLNFPANYRVKKISIGGMLIESLLALNVEDKYHMEITLPEDEPIKFTGRVASCFMMKGRGTEHFDIGIEFLELSDQNREKIRNFTNFLDNMDKGSSIP